MQIITVVIFVFSVLCLIYFRQY